MSHETESDQPPVPGPGGIEPPRLMTLEQHCEYIETLLKEILDHVRRDVGSGRLGH